MYKRQDFSVRLPGDRVGLAGKIADTFNQIVASNDRMASELERVGQLVGKAGKVRNRVRFSRRVGAWVEMESTVNTLIDDLLRPTRQVTAAIETAGDYYVIVYSYEGAAAAAIEYTLTLTVP